VAQAAPGDRIAGPRQARRHPDRIDGDEFELYRDVTRFVKRQSTNAAEVFEEIEQLSALAQQAERVEAAGCEAKLSRLKALMQQEGLQP